MCEQGDYNERSAKKEQSIKIIRKQHLKQNARICETVA